jgi:hypothetical protein
VAALVATLLWWYFHPAVLRTNAVACGQHALALDVIQPKFSKGVGVLVLVSGGWKSTRSGGLATWCAAPLLRRRRS